MPIPEISAVEAREWLASEKPPRLIDVREQNEWDLCHLPNAELLPLSRFGELFSDAFKDPEQALLVYCHHGMRSAQVTQFLQKQGFEHAVNLGGGIDAWSLEVDPSVPRY